MVRLATALQGDWQEREVMQQGELFPHGGWRSGVVHARLAAGGTALIYEVHSDGSAGKLEGFLTFWWDEPARTYRVFTCFNDPANPCAMRGTAHWENDTFVNDYELTIAGKPTRWRDSFTFTPTSHTLTAAVEVNGTMRTLITTTARRK